MLSIQEITKAVEYYSSKYDIIKAVLVGDYANGNPTEESDVYLLLDFNNDISLASLGELQYKLTEMLGKNVWPYDEPIQENALINLIREKDQVIYEKHAETIAGNP